MEDKLISAKALLDKLSVDEDWDKRVSLGGALADFIILICDAPAIEAKPVVHAHWENAHLNRYGHPCHNCSNCGFCASCLDKNWCANCGAQMDEVVSDNNVGSKTEGVKIPVISMEDVPKLAKESD